MNVLIVGTGVIGTLYGWALYEGGHQVTHLVRKGKRANLREGIRMDILDERKGHPKNQVTTYRPKCIETLQGTESFDWIILPTNVYQTVQALKDIIPLSGDGMFLILSSNWTGTEEFDALLPANRYVLGYPDGGGTFRNGLLWGNIGGEIHLAEYDSEGQKSAKLQQLIEMFAAADIKPDLQRSMLHWLWLHNAMSTALWAGFAKYKEVRPFLKDRALLKQCFEATKECLELCRQRGVDLNSYPEIATFKMPKWIFVIAIRFLYTYNKSMQRFTAHAADSLEEMRVHYGAMLDSAQQMNVSMPAYEQLQQYVH